MHGGGYSIWAVFLLTCRIWSRVMLMQGRNVTVHSYVMLTYCYITS